MVLSTRARSTVPGEAASPTAPRTMSVWHWPEITPSMGSTVTTWVLLQALSAIKAMPAMTGMRDIGRLQRGDGHSLPPPV